MKRWLPNWVSEYRDRHGKPRYRFRRKGYAQYFFKHPPRTEGFRQEYQACLEGVVAEIIQPGAERIRAGSFHDLISRYYRSPDFLNPGDRTREVYRGVIERWRAKYGDGMVRDLRSSHVEKMMAEMLPHRTAANMLRKRLNALLNYASGKVSSRQTRSLLLDSTRSRARAFIRGVKKKSLAIKSAILSGLRLGWLSI